ncbi:hypothetical protein D3C83_25470 [compost metagenome]
MRGVERDAQSVGDRGARRLDVRLDEGRAGHRRHFARDADETQAVPAIGRGLQRQHPVVVIGFDVFHLDAAQGDRFRELVRRERRVDEGAQPAFGELHEYGFN